MYLDFWWWILKIGQSDSCFLLPSCGSVSARKHNIQTSATEHNQTNITHHLYLTGFIFTYPRAFFVQVPRVSVRLTPNLQVAISCSCGLLAFYCDSFKSRTKKLLKSIARRNQAPQAPMYFAVTKFWVRSSIREVQGRHLRHLHC